jgi:phage tail sheath protein FI
MSVAQRKTPGVYIVEENAFPNSVVEVPTGIPVFIGYTEKALRGDESLLNVPTRISSFDQYVEMFGEAPPTLIKLGDDGKTLSADGSTRFLMYQSLKFFYMNGGGDCWIVSVGGYKDGDNAQAKSAGALTGPLKELEKVLEPAIIHIPDSVLLDSDGTAAQWGTVSKELLLHCGEMQSRVAILDVASGDKARDFSDNDVISGNGGFRGQLGGAPFMNYGMAYYPWVDTTVLELEDIGLANLDPKARELLSTKIAADKVPNAAAGSPAAIRNTKLDALAETIKSETDAAKLAEANKTALSVSPDYKRIMANALAVLNRLPPGAGMAGVYARTDANFGVFRAPANMGMIGVVKPSLEISAAQQEDLNAPLDGMAINAIRTFIGRGVLIWGARTLDANSLDWRYVNVRRTMIMLEQSIKAAAEAYVFAPNDSTTWVSVKGMIENFLTNQWKAGALAGSKAADAFDVSVGLGTTMTSVDILEGYMRITVRVAVVRPAEFIVITFRQKMQTS